MTHAVTVRDRAEGIADAAMRTQRGGAAKTALIDQGMAHLIARGREAQEHRNGRELAIFERDFSKIAVFIDALVEGNYRDTAAKLAGIAERSIKGWMSAAANGDERYSAIADLVHAAEAVAEAESVALVRAAGRDPRNWASAATYLERKWPERWGRRTNDNSGPGVFVQIGVKDSDVQVQIGSAVSPSALPGVAGVLE